jgi:hypothetical protein
MWDWPHKMRNLGWGSATKKWLNLLESDGQDTVCKLLDLEIYLH